VATLQLPTAGTIEFDGIDVLAQPERLRSLLGYLPQDFGVYENLTAFEFLQYLASLRGVHDSRRVRDMLELVNLHGVADRMVGGFSGGMKQRLGIAQALINQPELVIVDEPTAGLDPEERVRFRNLLSEIGFGKLVILSTHIVSDIESVATQIAIMSGGQLAAVATPEELLQAAAGSVWELVMPSDDFARARAALKVSSAVRQGDGVHVRVVSRSQPWTGARPAAPTLEDAFLAAIQSSAPREGNAT
jgi:ABC-type multidrug transport system ATPase subunit